MSILNNSVGNLKGTPAMLTDTLANRPDPITLAVGTIFIDSATGNWYQVGTNNTWSSTGGGGGSSNLQTVLNNGNQASEQSIYLTGFSNNLQLQINNNDDNASYIQLKSLTSSNQFIKIQQSSDGQSPNITIRDSDTQYISMNYNYIEIYNPDESGNNNSGFLSWENNGIEYYSTSFNKKIRNLQYRNTQQYKDLTNNTFQQIRANELNFFNQSIDIPRYSGTIATAELCNENIINLSTGNYNFGVVFTQSYFVITNGSVTNRIILSVNLNNLVVYNFLNKSTPVGFTNPIAGGNIYGVSTGLPAGLIQVVRNGNDFYITHP
jgi:hypothetical protein